MHTTYIFSDVPADNIETLLNNLEEADFDSHNISVIMQDEKNARAIAEDTGPLKGVTGETLAEKLHALGVTDIDSKIYQQQINNNRALIALAIPRTFIVAAKQMIEDYQPIHLIVV